MSKNTYAYEHSEKRIKQKKKYYLLHKKEINERSKKWRQEHRNRVNELARKRRKENPEKVHIYHGRCYQKRRLKAYQKISGLQKPICANCSCDDIRFLEINHINGGGVKERKRASSGAKYLYLKIIRNERKTEDLNILCRVCNSLDYLKRKYGKVLIKVIWNK